MLQINLRKPPLGNKLVRQALSLAIDRVSINKNLLGDQFGLANGFIPRGDFAYDENLAPQKFDPAKAKDLLRQAGYAGELIVLEDTPAGILPNPAATNQAIAQMWKDVGVNAKYQPIEPSVRVETRAKGTFTGVISGLPISGTVQDPDYIMWRSLGLRDLYGWEGAGFNEFLRLGNETYTLDQAVRLKNFQRMNQIAMDEMPSIPLYFSRLAYGMSRYVELELGPSSIVNMRRENLRLIS